MEPSSEKDKTVSMEEDLKYQSELVAQLQEIIQKKNDAVEFWSNLARERAMENQKQIEKIARMNEIINSLKAALLDKDHPEWQF